MSKKCINCAAELHDDASFCHHCECSQVVRSAPVVPRRRKNSAYLLIAVLLLAAAVCFVGVWSAKQSEQTDAAESLGQTAHEPEGSNTAATDISEANDPEPSGSPVMESHEISEPDPSVEYLSDYQARVTDGGDVLRVFATFQEEQMIGEGDDYFTTKIGQSEEYFKRVYVYAVWENTGELAKEAFLNRVETAYVEVLDAESGANHATVSAVECEDRGAALDAGVAFTSNSGKLELVWRIVLKNGSELVFFQTMEIFKKDQLVYTPENAAMDTMEELRALVSKIEAETDPETEVIIHLPAVRYAGTLELNRAFSFYGSKSESGMTTFTDTVICNAPESYIICFFDIAFEGNGTGTGVEDHCGVFFGGCTLRNWEIAAKTGETGWVVPAGCTFEDNKIGLQYNCRRFWFNNNEFIDDCFRYNQIAIEINQMPRTQTLTFPNTRFYGNGEVLVDRVGQPADLSGAEIT